MIDTCGHFKFGIFTLVVIQIIYCLILVYFIQSHTGTNLKNASLQKLLDILYTDTVIEDLDYIFKFGNTVLCILSPSHAQNLLLISCPYWVLVLYRGATSSTQVV